jgi:hypothetical protein
MHTQNSNNYGLSTATVVMRTRLSVTLCVHCLSCLCWFLGPVILENITYRRNLSKSGRGNFLKQIVYTDSWEQSTSSLDGMGVLSMG